MNKRILIIGSHGMLGQDLVKVFEADQNWEVFAYDRDEIDIASEKSLREIIGKIDPSAVVNATGYNAVDKCETDEIEYELAKKINGYGPGMLAKLGKEKGFPVVHYSTDYVFDGEKGEYNENDKPSPISNYGRSKFLGEEEIQKNTDKFWLIRTSKLFGKPGRSIMAKKSFFDTMIQAAKDNSILKVVDEEKSCFTYTPDLALETKKIIEEQISFGIYHVVNEEACTWHEATAELFRLAKMDVELIPVPSSEFPRPAKRPRSSVLLNTKLKPLRSYKDALKEYLDKNYNF
ncbi:MAG: dTDP-4-dehydrorhamnose reductase [Candidatus Moranbacteria bacterium RBG_13_45_13]|nr:MAG: dTDP-4-dehydrorhamnose reductase [Candidatus Moranbacteria bacterium RBG_13_45_13]